MPNFKIRAIRFRRAAYGARGSFGAAIPGFHPGLTSLPPYGRQKKRAIFTASLDEKSMCDPKMVYCYSCISLYCRKRGEDPCLEAFEGEFGEGLLGGALLVGGAVVDLEDEDVVSLLYGEGPLVL